MPSRRKNPTKTAESKIRVISGQWRGRKLPVLDEPGLRPTGNRIKETLFNWLSPYIVGSRCLDAFAGSGALGVEALSRGAIHADFIDNNREVVQVLRSNLALLKCNNATVQHMDPINWLNSKACSPYDIIFIDPPFNTPLWHSTTEALINSHMLRNEALIYLESPRTETITAPESWQLHRQLNAGQVCARLYKFDSVDN